ncbi:MULTISPECIES: MurR/RpiR family transcriptional regulator [unclassified Pyramidobacter]|uniref:MurR/RpiR family transcriptional regulator n=1 Tax=unclassified Pyramidobacter TaxID=2632171 RepID=UPI0025FFD037|nr:MULTISPECIES: MurR/RpiR family transcriptional regulator [unclassified Pyramidobacter]MCI7403164.1 MurR/RpiR family transcriptional regulator [Pyramidobacter sp.]MDY3211905.1 MurR/RpiR family transcriptional regulator [Pyramidobacter sp.]WOL39543.1 MurR/RpiR family transcriptional regulator [Pyramidobacter sp. YE332]
MEANKLQELLRSNLDSMPSKARRVVEYLLTHMREAAFVSIGDVAEQLNVSKAQLVRVARILGFTGYADLKSALKESVLEQVNPAAMLARAMSEEGDLSERIRQMEHANLEDTWNRLRVEDVRAFCELVKSAEGIYCAGWSISGMMAECLHSRLRELGLRAHQMYPGSGCLTLIEQARSVRKSDLIIAFDLPSYSVLLTEALQRGRRNGAKIVTITDSPAAPICSDADLSFFVSDNSPTFGSSLIGPLFLIHILTSRLSIDMGDDAMNALAEQSRILRDERLYHPVYSLRY